MKSGIIHTLLYGDTAPVRFWMAVFNIIYGLFLFKTMEPGTVAQIAAFEYRYSALIWISLYFTHAGLLFYGLSKNRHKIVAYCEGLMGWGIWTFTAVANTMATGMIGPLTVSALIMTWVVVRYPMKWKGCAHD